ncbi:MAG TPA: BrnT family toxin [Blastocatellia bacterium]|nr:BrnT family toxin [Blastocatellia bacterium]
MEFEWDPEKSESNLRHHGVSFQEAATVFDDALSITVPDPDHSFDEERYIIVGISHEGRLLIVSHAERGDHIRIISARELSRDERSAYEEGDFT